MPQATSSSWYGALHVVGVSKRSLMCRRPSCRRVSGRLGGRLQSAGLEKRLGGPWGQAPQLSRAGESWTTASHSALSSRSELRMLMSPDLMKAVIFPSRQVIKCVCKKCFHVTTAQLIVEMANVYLIIIKFNNTCYFLLSAFYVANFTYIIIMTTQ